LYFFYAALNNLAKSSFGSSISVSMVKVKTYVQM
jgi:hypothetical protein